MMHLHEDEDAFASIMESVSERTGYREDVIEKDYYVTLFLEELANMQRNGLTAYFKGGTALYKALKSTKRFSEDIDLSVDARGCSRSQEKKRLNDASKRYGSLQRIESEGTSNRSAVLASYRYRSSYSSDREDPLQRFGRVKVEATSFTISEPIEALTVAPLVYDLADSSEKRILSEKFDVDPFEVMTISFERIFIDKLFAAEAYSRTPAVKDHAFEAAKHIYDLAVIAEHPRTLALLEDDDRLRDLLLIRYQEEQARLDGIPGIATRDFMFFGSSGEDELVRKAYERMLAIYVFCEEDRIPLERAIGSIRALRDKLEALPSWNDVGILHDAIIRKREDHDTAVDRSYDLHSMAAECASFARSEISSESRSEKPSGSEKETTHAGSAR